MLARNRHHLVDHRRAENHRDNRAEIDWQVVPAILCGFAYRPVKSPGSAINAERQAVGPGIVDTRTVTARGTITPPGNDKQHQHIRQRHRPQLPECEHAVLRQAGPCQKAKPKRNTTARIISARPARRRRNSTVFSTISARQKRNKAAVLRVRRQKLPYDQSTMNTPTSNNTWGRFAIVILLVSGVAAVHT